MLAVVLIPLVRRQEIGMLLVTAVCAMAIAAAMRYLEPVTDLLKSLEALGGLDTRMIGILLKTVGIGLTTEITCMVCADSGNASLGRALQLLGTVVILWIALPLFTALLDLVRQILEDL